MRVVACAGGSPLAIASRLVVARGISGARDGFRVERSRRILQANVRAAARHEGDRTAAVAARPAAHDERIDDLLAAVAAGHEGDGLPARIEALLRRDDDAVRAVLAFIRGDKATKMIVDALAASGTPASQDALCALARDVHLPAHVRAEAVSSLGLIKRPTAPTMTAIAELDPRGRFEAGRG